MLTADKVSACLVTRGDQPEQLARIIQTLPYAEVIVWDNSQARDLKTAGRYQAMLLAEHDVVYFQDDDTLFERHDELIDAFNYWNRYGYSMVSTYGHGENDGGYGDLPLVCGGALAEKRRVLEAMRRYRDDDLAEWPDEDLYYADFAVGVLLRNWCSPRDLSFEINMGIAQHTSRLCNQPWAADAKRRVTERARAIRDMVPA
jgi:hypothetical protein